MRYLIFCFILATCINLNAQIDSCQIIHIFHEKVINIKFQAVESDTIRIYSDITLDKYCEFQRKLFFVEKKKDFKTVDGDSYSFIIDKIIMESEYSKLLFYYRAYYSNYKKFEGYICLEQIAYGGGWIETNSYQSSSVY